MNPADLPALTITDLQALLRRRDVAPREALEALRARIDQVEPKIDAYLSIDFAAAAKEAETVDVDLPLGGVPIAIKDIINVAGQPCTCASKILRNYRSPYDATVIRKLRAAGAIRFGKPNLVEFAMGSSTVNSSV
jgi:aspartyl-tRNA(Asn)/glutamyl-tRNA(Gln) amidotransferase subunit A